MALPIYFNNVGNRSQQQASGAIVPQALRSATIDLACSLPHNELARLYRAIETMMPGRQNHVVQFASAYDNEGASTIAFETAIIAAKLIGKRVLFIDTSPLQSNMHKKLPESVGVPLDTLLLTGRPPHEAIVQAAGTDLYFAMLRPRDEAEEFAPVSLSAVAGALENLRSSFDLIVIDSQQIMTDAFGLALSKLVDGTILVVEAERTRAPVALESQRLIAAGGGHVIGAVLNKRRLYIPKFLYRFLYRQSV